MTDFVLSDDRAQLDISRIHGWLASSYWSPGIARETVERAIAGSHCLGAYRDATQVAFARMITDHATFAWLADVWVEEAWRGHGLGKRLVAWFLDHPDFQGIRRFALVTRDAHEVYAAKGFYPLIRPERYMERLAPAFADALRSAP
ncbi:GNAT family N-acetyltransferase [Sphingomonas sp.]|uniref:GNAT family N-acetyltransferase n=1 Tax=Sphingomonas sp. TaxID=28214 RepID=UPI003B3B0CD1